MLRRALSGTLAAVLLVGGCTGGGDSTVEDAMSSTAVPTTVPPITSTTTVATTTTVPSLPAIPYDIVWVDFDGRECVVSGPISLAAGTVVPVVLTNESGIVAKVAVARVWPHVTTGIEWTFQDFAELQRAAGGVLWDDLANLIESPMNMLALEHLAFPPVNWSGLELAENQSLRVFALGSEMGADVIFVSTQGEFNAEYGVIPEAYWFCAPLEVTAIEF